MSVWIKDNVSLILHCGYLLNFNLMLFAKLKATRKYDVYENNVKCWWKQKYQLVISHSAMTLLTLHSSKNVNYK